MSEADITLKKKNETYLQVSGDAGIIMEMQDHFQFEVPGAKWHPKVRARMWDGRIRLLNLKDRTIFAGLYHQIVKFCKDRHYTIDLEANGYYGLPGEQENISYEEIEQFAKSLDLHSQGKPIEIYDYQINAILEALTHKRKLILAPTSAGKSLILYVLIRYLQSKNEDFRFLIIVPTVGLVSQMFFDFKDYSSANGWSVEDSIHKISAGENKKTSKPIVVSTYQSIYKLQGGYFNGFDVMICDEAHKAAADSISGIFEKATDVKYRFGCTGTLNDSKCHAMVLQGLTGETVQVTTTKKLMDQKRVAQLEIKCIVLKYSEEVRKAFKKADYDKEIGYIVTNERRNKFIAKLATNTAGTTLVLFNYVEKQGKPLYEMIKNMPDASERPVYLITGDTSTDEREAIRQEANRRPVIVVASYGTSSTGISVPAIETVIFASPSKAKIRNLQSIGRGLRLKDGKLSCTLYDIVDDMSMKSYINHTLRHFGERVKQYTAEEFEFTITRIDF